jgi:hypothetical protein
VTSSARRDQEHVNQRDVSSSLTLREDDASHGGMPKLLRLAVAVIAAVLASCGGGSQADRPMAACVLRFTDTNELHGTLTKPTQRAYAGARAIKATYDGSTLNGYARGVWHVDWRPGEEVRWGTAAYLPKGTMADVADFFALMRWDNFGAYGSVGDDKGGIVFHRGRGWRLTGGPMDLPIPALPENRWFTIEVHQVLSQGSSGLSEVYVDGQKVASTSGRNMARSPIDRLRVGIVAITAGEQNKRLTAYVDRAWVSQGSGSSGDPCG